MSGVGQHSHQTRATPTTGGWSPIRAGPKTLFHKKDDARREIDKTEAEWKQQLTDEQFRVLRRKSTERPFSGAHVHPPGTDGFYRCVGCGAPLFAADAQFDSGTGWPSFTGTMADRVELRRDFSGGIPRTEALCRRCGGHLGHLFKDGPGRDRSRYCINSCALTLDEKATSA